MADKNQGKAATGKKSTRVKRSGKTVTANRKAPAGSAPGQDKRKTKDQLIDELARLRRRCAGLERSGKKYKQAITGLEKNNELLLNIASNYPNSYMSIIEKDLSIGFSSGGEFSRQNLDPKSFEGLSIEDVFGQHTPLVRDNYLKTFRGEETAFELDIDEQSQLYNTVPIYGEDGGIHRILVVVENITDRKRMGDELNRLLTVSERRRREKEALLEASKTVLEMQGFKEAARKIFDSCTAITGAVSGYVALLSGDESENEVLFLESGGLPCSVDPSLPMPIRGLRAEAYKTGRTVYDNAFMDSEWIDFLPGGHVRLDNVMFAPLKIEGNTVGIIGLANKPGGFDENDVNMATAFGELAAIALNNSRMHDQLVESNINLTESLGEKEMLIKEVYHRVKNNLIVVQSLLRLQSISVSEEKYREYFIESQNRVRAMSMIHEMLYSSPDLSSMDFPNYIRALARMLFDTYSVNPSQIKLELHMSNVLIDVNVIIPCGLIINELVSNALKYAFPGGEKGRLHIGLSEGGDGDCRLVIGDNGIGLPNKMDISRTESLGMQIVTSLIKQIDGRLDLKRDGGTEFRVSFSGRYDRR
jgi:two-component sensor histidine kinase